MWLAVAIVIACAGCKQLLGIDEGVVAADASGIDQATTDSSIDMGAVCLGTTPNIVCTMGFDTPFTVVTDVIVDTTLCPGEIDSHDWCVIGGSSVSIQAVLQATGTRPLVILSKSTLMIGTQGVVDASSRTNGTPGPHANDATCGTAGSGNNSVNGGGGGAGGSFRTRGGKGGDGDSGATNGGSPTVPMPIPTTLRGGCSGGLGGTTANPPGAGGGAVYLLAATSIEINGRVNASGAGGGSGKASKGGGSGGGSGGVIFFSAPLTSVAGSVWANGGGGGGGADNGAVGSPGQSSPAPNTVGGGGAGGSALVGRGGAGSIDTAQGENGVNDATGAGGGGGGGGAGAIRVFGSSDLTGQLSPPPS